MKANKARRGRPPIKPDQRKALTRSVRMTPGDFEMLIERFGSLQSFFDLAVIAERNLKGSTKSC